MRRRFTLAIVGVVAGALLVAGVGSLVLLTVQSHRNSRSDVTDLASRIATEAGGNAGAQRTPALSRLQNFLKRTEQLALVTVSANGAVGGAPPAGIPVTDLDGTALAAGRVVSGYHGKNAFAAAPFTVRGRVLAAVVSEPLSSAGGAGLYLLLASGAGLLVAFGVAETLSRRIIHPVVQIQQAAGRIADGDLSARAPATARSYRELESLTGSVNAMADSLERLRGEERQFLMSVSHDLRTPLTSIRGYAEALADGTTADTAKAAAVIVSEATRLERLVRDLLDLAKLDTRRFGMDLRVVDLWEVVSDTAEGFSPSAERLGLELLVHDPVVRVAGADGRVVADPDRLAQVIANVVENACKYATSRVTVTTWMGGAESEITIDDDGPGIPTEDLPRVFDRLWTNSRGGARQVGSGLGLAIASELVAAMGGRIRVESPVPEAQSGTRFVVGLRAAPAERRSRVSRWSRRGGEASSS